MTTNLPATRSDGFDNYTESVDGHEDRPSSGGGIFVNFAVDGQWHQSTDKSVVTGLTLVAMNIQRRCVRRTMVDGKPKNAEVQVIEKGPWPDTEAWNAQLPASEKIPDFNGKPTGPWSKETVMSFVDPDTLQKYTWTARMDTAGAAICVRDLREKVAYMRQFRPRATAIVTLSTTPMPTRFGVRPRPHFDIVKFIDQGGGGDGEAVAALPAPVVPPTAPAPSAAEIAESEAVVDAVVANAKAAKAKAAKSTKSAKAAASKSFFAPQTVTPPGASEELNDAIPNFGR